MKVIFSSSLSLLILLSGCAALSSSSPPPKMNIIYIMADDLGWGDLGCFGQEDVATPRLDRLASEGVRFTDHYAGNTVCRPSRLVLWTGQHTGHTAISSNAYYNFSGGETTVAELLSGAGYATGGCGKWAMGRQGTPGHPNLKGFDDWFGYLDQGDAHNYYPTHLWHNREKVALEGNVLTGKKKDHGLVAREKITYSHDVMVDWALDWIKNHADEPFLFHGHFTIPHANNEGGAATGDGMEVPTLGEYQERDWPAPEKGFAAMVTRLDRDVGRIVDLLKELKIADRTYLIFTSDNGPHQEGGHRHGFFNSNGPFRGFKRDLYDGGIRVPMIAWCPSVIPPGVVSEHISGFQDFMPTACEIAGIAAPEEIDGISYLPAMHGEPEEQEEHPYLYWRFKEIEALRGGAWKALRKSSTSPLELYHIGVDLGEEQDLSGDHPDLVQRFEAWFEEIAGADPR